MQAKKLILAIIFALGLFLIPLFVVPRYVRAGYGSGGCSCNYNCDCQWNARKHGFVCNCRCPSGCGNTGGTCDPGTYRCNRNGGSCCPIGPGRGGGGGGGGGGGAPACNTSAATSVAITAVSSNSSKVTWTPGANGTSQRIYIGADKTKVEGNCPSGVGAGTGCVEQNTALTTTQNSYTTGNSLVSGTVYYYRVVTYKDTSCSSNSATALGLSSCLVSPSSTNLTLGDTITLNTNVSSSTEIGSVAYTPTGGVTVNPAVDNTYSYSTAVKGTADGPATVASAVRNTGGTTLCTASSNITVIPPKPWWQVVDSDINSRGDLNSAVKSPNYFDIAGLGGYPGVPSFTSTTDLTNSTVSPLGWLADSDNLDTKIFDYQYFANQIPKDTVITTVPSENIAGTFFESGGTLSYGYYWYKYDGSTTGLDLTLTSAMNLGDRKVILLINSADFYIKAPINLNDGRGFFLVTVGQGTGTKGNIIIDPTLGGGAGPNLEGIYEADSQFKTNAAALQLKVRGSVAAYDGVLMQRDLVDTNLTTPAEQFEFAPDQIMLFPTKLGFRKLNWKEVAP